MPITELSAYGFIAYGKKTKNLCLRASVFSIIQFCTFTYIHRETSKQ